MRQTGAVPRQGKRRRAIIAVALGTCGLLTSAAGATEFDDTVLNTSPFTVGEAYGVHNGQVAGAGFRGAQLWTDPNTYVQLNPTGFTSSVAYGIWGNQQVGVGYDSDGNPHALLWTGTAASAVELTSGPAPRIGKADATDGAQQVGVAGGAAALWTGTQASYVRLAPPGYTASEATSVWNGVQVGFGGELPSPDALLWHGTAGSAVVLRKGSEALGISRGQVVGWAGNGATNEAAMWTAGTADSYVDLAPPGTTASEIFATNGVQQVGDVSLTHALPGFLPGDHHPGVWHGTPSSFQMLPLPNGDTFGFVYGIDGNGDIVGVSASGPLGGNFVPVLWTQNAAPGDVNYDGSVGFDDLVVLAAHYGMPGERVDGDLNGDGIVNFADLVILAQNYGRSQGVAPTYSVTVQAPEPMGIAIIGMLALSLPRRRR